MESKTIEVEFCRRWKVIEMGFFGSILRDDFSKESDVDILVSFEPQSSWTLFALVDMQDELEGLLGRKVDLVEREAIKNPFRRKEILRTLEMVYAA
ncbi:MAG: nucleotidyltransferase family protein [Deltaproteobacteria bacterium]|nr:nucleotidyltransferase family protein [Deltaproteobacteria bacterium]